MEANLLSIKWPEPFDPARAQVHVRNVLESRAPAGAVWAWLVRASRWPEWYQNSHGVAIEGGAKDLGAGSSFRWSTFGVRLKSEVAEFVPGERIAWTARGIGVFAYHAWLLAPNADGCTILTEETQSGFVARLGALFMPKRMYEGHEQWLAALDGVAKTGMP